MSALRNLTRRRRPANLAPPAGQQPRVPMVGRGLLGATFASLYSNNDPERQMDMFGRSGTLYSNVSFNAGSFSTVAWRMFRTRDGRGRISGPDPRTEVTSHAALDMWRKPNKWMPGQLFRESFGQHIELTGLGFWVISFAGSIP